jgi:energy-coupling factor transporter ATP-binding protein EcfA2
MKIKSIKTDGHPVLGTFEYNFEDNKPITLLVGMNGAGKTRLIEEMYKILNNGFRMWSDETYQNHKVKTRMHIVFSGSECALLGIATGNLIFESDCTELDVRGGWSTIRVLNADDGTDVTAGLRGIIEPSQTGYDFQKLFQAKLRNSSVQINFEYEKITNIGADVVDDEKKSITKSTPKLSTEINRLLVAIRQEDDRILAKESREKGLGHKDIKGNFDRFKDAFEKFCPNKEMLGVVPNNGEYQIQIKDVKTGKLFGIEGLSSGEQQVIYRVGYLLRNVNIKEGGVVFIDEPELSLHPELQINYIPFLKELFGSDIQFVIATHSPYVVKSGIDDSDVSISKIFIGKMGLEDDKLHHTSKLGKATFAEVNYKAFNIASEEFHTELYLALQRTYSPERWDAGLGKYVDGMPWKLDQVISKKTGVTVLPTWKDVNSGRSCTETIMTFVRNLIHHGDDAVGRGRGRTYTHTELRQSIEEMLKLL